MSARKPDLTHPLVLGALVAGLALVIVVNVRTFGGRKPLRAPRAAAGPVISTEGRDALAFLAEAVDAGTLTYAESAKAPSRFDWPDRLRDPFAAEPMHGRGGAAASKAAGNADAEDLRCDAVLLRGPDPVALIGGRPCRVGDEVAGAVVRAIDVGGVTLERAGRTVRLPLMADAETGGRAWIVRVGDAARVAPDGMDEDGGTR